MIRGVLASVISNVLLSNGERRNRHRRADRHHHQEATVTRIIVTIGLLVAAVLYLYWLGAFDLPISIARWWIGGHGRR